MLCLHCILITGAKQQGGVTMLRLAFFIIAFPLLLAAGCTQSDIAGKAGWADWPSPNGNHVAGE